MDKALQRLPKNGSIYIRRIGGQEQCFMLDFQSQTSNLSQIVRRNEYIFDAIFTLKNRLELLDDVEDSLTPGIRDRDNILNLTRASIIPHFLAIYN